MRSYLQCCQQSTDANSNHRNRDYEADFRIHETLTNQGTIQTNKFPKLVFYQTESFIWVPPIRFSSGELEAILSRTRPLLSSDLETRAEACQRVAMAHQEALLSRTR